MINRLKYFLSNSYTAYQAVENSRKLLEEKGFERISEGEKWNLKRGGKYYVCRGGSALIAFTVGEGKEYKIVASHTDSPCFKLKENPVTETAGYKKLNVESYGGGLYYSFFDRPLKIAGRIVVEKDGKLISKNVVSPFTVVIPSLAIHMNRDANSSLAPNVQVDMLPLLSSGDVKFDSYEENIVSHDLYAVCAQEAFDSGIDGEFISSPRIDNLSSVLSSLEALGENNSGICVAACLDNEEVGSQTAQGAGGDFLSHTLERIARSLGIDKEEYYSALSSSFLISLDNAHSIHPNHPEKCDITNRAKTGGGIVIKGHANKAYTTDAISAAVIKTVFKRANVRYQTFFNRSDMRSGGKLGAISLGQVSIPSVDLGLAQLAMHSAVETVAKDDYISLIDGLKAFYKSEIHILDDEITVK